jgi:hypothetical protein
VVYLLFQLNDLLVVDMLDAEVTSRARLSEEVGVGGGKERGEKDDCLPLRRPVRIVRSRQ